MNAVETLRSRARFAESRGSTDFANHLNRIADLGEKAAQAEIDATRAIGKELVGIMERSPTREEARAAATILLLCNGHDLDVWTDGEWPSDSSQDGLRALAKVGAP